MPSEQPAAAMYVNSRPKVRSLIFNGILVNPRNIVMTWIAWDRTVFTRLVVGPDLRKDFEDKADADSFFAEIKLAIEDSNR